MMAIFTYASIFPTISPDQSPPHLTEVGDGGEYDAHSRVGLTVQFLKHNPIKTLDLVDHSKQYSKKEPSIFLRFIKLDKNRDLQKDQTIKKKL